jgi:hypothetical protein
LDILEENREKLEVVGYSFHIDTRDLEVRKAAFWESFEYIKLLKKSGFSPGIVDI